MEAILQLRQFNPLGIYGCYHFIKLFLRCDHDPAGGNDLAFLQQVLTDSAEFFNGRPQILDFVTATGDMLSDLINDEDKGFALAAASPEFERSLNHLADGDRCVSIALGVRPRIRRRIELRIELMQNGACTR